MQKRFFSFFTAAIVAVILFSSCSKSNKQGRYIPATAGIVIHLNGESLTSKLPWDDIKQNDLFKKMSSDTTVPAFAKAIMDNPENSGVEIKSDLEIFLVKDSAGGYAGIEGSIKDAAKFKQFLSNAQKEGKETVKDNYTYFSDEKTAVGYDKSRFIALINMPQLDYMNRMNEAKMPTDSVFGGMDEVKYTRDMAGIAAQLFAMKEEQSLAKNDKFSELISTTGDAHFWYNAQYFNPAAGMGNMGAMAAMVNTSKLTEGAITTGIVNFENGKINFDSKTYGSKEMTALFEKYSRDGFDKSMAKNIPSQNIAGMFIFSFKPEGVREFLKLLNVDGLVNLGAAQAGFNLDDFIKANKGDILFSVSDIKSDTLTGTNANFLFSASIADRPSFDKLIAAGKKFGPEMMGESAEAKFSFAANDKYFVFSNDKATADGYLAGKGNMSSSFLDKISDGPFGGYVNLQYIISSMRGNSGSDSIGTAMHEASLKMWDNILISGGNFKGGAISQHWEVNLVDKNTNSLKQLNAYSGTMGTLQQRKMQKMEEMWRAEDVMTDSTQMIK